MPNPTGHFRWNVRPCEILLDPHHPTFLTMPSAALIDAAELGQGLYVRARPPGPHALRSGLSRTTASRARSSQAYFRHQVILAYTGSIGEGEESSPTTATPAPPRPPRLSSTR